MAAHRAVAVEQPPSGGALFKDIGPGVVWAALAIGGGELVLIPRVGAIYGIMFLWMPLLAIALKYFMVNEIGRWSVVTGTSIYDGLAMVPGPRKWLSWILLVVSLYLGAVHIGGLVAMVGIISYNLVPMFSPFVWSILMMLSFVVLNWTNRYSILEKLMILITAMLTLTTVAIGLSLLPPAAELFKGLMFQIPSVTPDWAKSFGVSANPLVEILPAMAFAGCGAVNSLWYSDWVLSKGLGMGKYYNGLDTSQVEPAELKTLDAETTGRLKGWYRVMFHDALWGGNFLTLLVTFFYLTLAVQVLHPMQQAPNGPKFILTLSQVFTTTLGPWAKWLYLFGAWGVIYGTMATIYDGYARIINKSILICLPNWEGYRAISLAWRYRMWILYGTGMNFLLVFMLQAVPVQFLQAAAWIEGTFLLPVMAFSIAWLTKVKLPALLPDKAREALSPGWIFTLGTIAAGVLYAMLIVIMLAR